MISEPPSNWNFTLGSQSLSASKAFAAADGVFFIEKRKNDVILSLKLTNNKNLVM